MDYLQQAFEMMRKQSQKEMQEKQKEETIELLIRVQGAAFDKATAYSNVIMLAGYAGSFTLISATKEILSNRVLVFCSTSLGFSLLVFCSWEIIKMITNGKITLQIASLLDQQMPPQEFSERLAVISIEEKKIRLETGKWWLWVLFLTIVPAFCAGIILLITYIKYLCK